MNFNQKQESFKKYSLILLFYTLVVILWGAWVRISHSGDGCGTSWPLCGGELLPKTAEKSTWIEFSHRLSSGLFGICVLFMFFWGRRVYPRGSQIRKWLFVMLVLTATEALLGAKLVLSGLVGDNSSQARSIAMSLHMANSLMLTGSISFIWRLSDLNQYSSGLKCISKKISILLPVFFMLVCCFGAIAALSVTLYPSETLFTGMKLDFSADSPLLIRLRGLHPLLAFTFIGSVFLIIQKQKDRMFSIRLNKEVLLLVFLTIGGIFGLATLAFHSPVWMKLVHLLLAHIIWIILLFSISQSE